MSETPPAAAPTNLQTYWRLLKYTRPYLGLFLLSIAGYGMAASGKALLASVFKVFVDGLAADGNILQSSLWLFDGMNFMHAIPVMIILIAFWQGIGTFLGNYSIARVSLGLIHDLRVQLFNSFLGLPNQYYDQQNSGFLVSKITYNVTMVTDAATDAVKILFREGLTVIALLAYLFWMHWRLTLLLLTILPILAWLVSQASRQFRKHSRKIQTSMGALTHIASETIQGYRVVRSFGGEHFERERFHDASTDNRLRQLRMSRTEEGFSAILNLLIYLAMSGLLYMVLQVRGDTTAGDVVAYITAAGLLPRCIRQLGDVSAKIQRGVAAAGSIFEQLDEAPEPDHGKKLCTNVKGDLELKRVSFRYPQADHDTLSDISVSIAAGQTVALVGASGSGKSTLANLIPRFYRHQYGDICLDGTPIEHFTLSSLRRNIALVTQQVTLFHGTVAENIAYGELKNASREAITTVADAANATEFIEKLPLGFDTQIGENGEMLSGGQRQRLAIARALLKNAPLLILDEATSALDNESERLIQDALEHLTANRTTLVIAHRLSTIKNADLILVMENGRIIEQGTHETLLQHGGAYTNLQQIANQDTAIL